MSKLIPKATLYLKKRSPTILTCMSAAGVVVTAVLAAKATPKALKLLEKAEDEKGEELTKLETLLVATPAYISAVVVGTSTIACIFGANNLNKRQQAFIASAYALVNNSYKEYRNKLIELHGEEADQEVQTEMARQNCNYHQTDLDVPDNKVIFYDQISKRSIRCYERELMDAEYHLNRNFALRGWATLNEFYTFLGLKPTDYGNTVGWSMDDGYAWIDFQHHLVKKNDGSIFYVIDMMFVPDELPEDYVECMEV